MCSYLRNSTCVPLYTVFVTANAVKVANSSQKLIHCNGVTAVYIFLNCWLFILYSEFYGIAVFILNETAQMIKFHIQRQYLDYPRKN